MKRVSGAFASEVDTAETHLASRCVACRGSQRLSVGFQRALGAWTAYHGAV